MSYRIDSFDESTCCGCMACESKCPKKAIYALENEQGFIVPKVDESLCIDCGLCVQVCDFKKDEKGEDVGSLNHKAFSLIVKNTDVLKSSTSGGAFSAFSDVVLSKGGFIVGPVWEEGFLLSHQITNEVRVRDKMRGSKYTQSDTSGLFLKIEGYLEEGRLLLFTGTPCQCAGLVSFLKKDYKNLIIMDFLCHGVPNNKLFRDHINLLENHYKCKITDYKFREKKYGWDSYNSVVFLQNGKSHSRWINQVFYKFFVSSVSLRPSCYTCKYRTEKRYSDITVADFWGIERITGQRTKLGASLVITHTEKGESLLSECSNVVNCLSVDYSSVSYRLATKPVKSRLNRQVFWDTYKSGGYNALVQKYFSNSIFKQIRFEVRKIAKRLRLGR